MAGSQIGCLGLDKPARLSAALLAALAYPSTWPAQADDQPISAVIFGSLDAGPSAFLSGGTKVGLDGANREGFALLASGGAGRRTERPAAGPILTRWTAMGAALVGHQWFRDWGVVALFAGPEGTIEAVSGPAGTTTLPARFGLRLHGELWARPSAETLVTGTLILGSARGDLWTRLSYGVRWWDAYLGPEAAVYADGTGYRKWSFGLHATDVAVGGVRLRVSAGYLTEGGTSAGPYMAISTWQSF